jgi:hypothetical protein
MRHLIPNFFISTQPLGWQCSECGRTFPASGMLAITDEIPAAITTEFNAHQCRSRSPENHRRAEASAN